MKYYIHTNIRDKKVQGLMEYKEGSYHLIAMHGLGGEFWSKTDLGLGKNITGEYSEITKEEANMILFSLRESMSPVVLSQY